ncbi:hypothetical protein [Colwellia hornerae]|uniref:Uncharacterized protein n=1 Tax=Colwellia hornerae TaxID=89402 RepID=A0A5C6QRL8_9GAMM|nr:hypothetical protein [Colwellia hornerae]TWX55709.1 hypothetical protein ESZ28_05935 [Colwellia hornerae]TWX61919.1 hypothetical protein ESZ26_04710 [Colwellia hornerae]TWX71251.1 hypothetical protein ESZ27_02290 [Colwellia hornerae]
MYNKTITNEWTTKVDVLIDLLPAANQVKIAQSKKDKRQANKYNRQMNSAVSLPNVAGDTENGLRIKKMLWTGPERRSSADRRHLKNKRGRWLESRDRNDRRTTQYAISVKI